MSESRDWARFELTVELSENYTHRISGVSKHELRTIFKRLEKVVSASPYVNNGGLFKRKIRMQRSVAPKKLVQALMEKAQLSELQKDPGSSIVLPTRKRIEAAYRENVPVNFSYSSKRVRESGRSSSSRESRAHRASILSVHEWGFRVFQVDGVRSYNWEHVRHAESDSERANGFHVELEFQKGLGRNAPGSVAVSFMGSRAPMLVRMLG